MKHYLRKMVKKSYSNHNRHLGRGSCFLLLSTLAPSNVSAFVPPPVVRSTTFNTNVCVSHSSQFQANLSSQTHKFLQHRSRPTHLRSTQYDRNYGVKFRKGDLIQVEVVRFGPLGASVEIVSHNSHAEEDLLPEDDEPLGYGLILQSEIAYFRAARRGVDVVKGEILPAYVDWERNDGKVDITLRKPGGKGKAEDLGNIILEKLKESESNEIPIGDKSTPESINQLIPGASKASFKRAVASLYKKKLVQPGKFTTKLM